ncbi:MAG: hypothetical protein FWF78_10840 [Defluviitaleaceae bacterium]|nr:hypothetical protein [Defluviitaleaceae bacterium]
MAKLNHCSFDDFVSRLNTKKLACFGAGVNLGEFISQYQDYGIKDKINCIIDNYKGRSDNELYDKSIPIISLKKFINKHKNEYVIVITSYQYVDDIFDQINGYKSLNDIDCYFYKLFELDSDIDINNKDITDVINQNTNASMSGNKSVIKMAYIANFKKMDIYYSGVIKKIDNQISAFSKSSINVLKCSAKKHPLNSLNRKIGFLPFCSQWNYTQLIDNYGNYDTYYIRFFFNIDRPFIAFCKELKKINPAVKIILEIPTYPYDGENAFKTVSDALKDKINRKRLYKYVDRLVVFTDQKDIWGIKTINIINGVDVEGTRKRVVHFDNAKISIIAVANFEFWHGYDRFICGLGEYYKHGGKRNIILHLVGPGTPNVKKLYDDIIDRYNLKNHVIMHGKKTHNDLDDVYDKCSIALGSLGLHRVDKDLNTSTLKTGEYTAKGLPVMSSGRVDMYDRDYPYFLKLVADETPIDINQVITFYDKIYHSDETYTIINDEIRQLAMKTCDISITMEPVIDYIKGERA